MHSDRGLQPTDVTMIVSMLPARVILRAKVNLWTGAGTRKVAANLALCGSIMYRSGCMSFLMRYVLVGPRLHGKGRSKIRYVCNSGTCWGPFIRSRELMCCSSTLKKSVEILVSHLVTLTVVRSPILQRRRNCGRYIAHILKTSFASGMP
jgi:hypothetical protein